MFTKAQELQSARHALRVTGAQGTFPMDRTRRQRVLRQHVQTDQMLGATFVPVGDPVAPEGDGLIHEAAGGQPAPLPRAERILALETLDAGSVRGCTACPLHERRTRTVFGEGDPEARIMFIGEGPGQKEDEQGRPFVGRAGELLDKMIVAMGLERAQVYIANIVKCRPPDNRAPTPVEVEACHRFLEQQIRTILPEAIVTLGAPAARHILDTREGITRIRGTWHHYDGLLPEGPRIAVMPTFHPAYLLRSYTEENRRRVWSDLQAVMARVGTG